MSEIISGKEYAEILFNISIKSKDHLKEWLEASGRRWLVFDALNLVDSVSWPKGVDDVMDVVSCYQNYRSQIPSGRTEKQKDPTFGRDVEVPIMKTDMLEIEELDRCIRYLIKLASEKDSKWCLENSPL